MLDAGITVVRIAEFAWNKIEPEEGMFTFDFFDSFLDLCSDKGMKVIFGTPTATPPAWLTEKYPEVLNASKDGTLYRHGGRRHYNYNSPVYQKFCARIVEKEAMHYGTHPAIIGTATGTAYLVGNAECGAWSRFHFFFPLANLYCRNGNLLARNSGL